MAHATFHPHDLELRLGICGGRHRYYCPPDITVTDDELAKLNTLANMAIEQYNSTQGTNYTNVKVIETDTSVAAGTWYYLTFEASLSDDNTVTRQGISSHLEPDKPNTFDPQTFDAGVFVKIPIPAPCTEVHSVRLRKPFNWVTKPFNWATVKEKEQERKRRYVETMQNFSRP
ncbi:hypothetical protein POM88_027915 [Heracleum sosnowskyi]|uniref:Cystatin domain-containing protein n=1 Tax=Heracleum sosnowskyi TaxID=360622 RepID=A0AAD8I8V6_9APIA|nr:hypothetical protein POM88_027915 [Heracleum sosnowskyi]